MNEHTKVEPLSQEQIDILEESTRTLALLSRGSEKAKQQRTATLAALKVNDAYAALQAQMEEWQGRALRAEAALQRRNEMDMAMTPSGSGDR